MTEDIVIPPDKIIAIVSSAGGTRPVEEFRKAPDAAVAVAEFCAAPPTNPSDWIGVETDWSEVATPLHGGRWMYDGAGLVQSITPLEGAKIERREAINARTAALISAGFEHPAQSGHVFSLSDIAQRNLSELDKLRTGLTYPFTMATADDLVIDSVTSADDLHARYLTGLARIQWSYGTGNALKAAVNACTTQAELDAVVDSR